MKKFFVLLSLLLVCAIASYAITDCISLTIPFQIGEEDGVIFSGDTTLGDYVPSDKIWLITHFYASSLSSELVLSKYTDETASTVATTTTLAKGYLNSMSSNRRNEGFVLQLANPIILGETTTLSGMTFSGFQFNEVSYVVPVTYTETSYVVPSGYKLVVLNFFSATKSNEISVTTDNGTEVNIFKGYCNFMNKEIDPNGIVSLKQPIILPADYTLTVGANVAFNGYLTDSY